MKKRYFDESQHTSFYVDFDKITYITTRHDLESSEMHIHFLGGGKLVVDSEFYEDLYPELAKDIEGYFCETVVNVGFLENLYSKLDEDSKEEYFNG